MKILISNDDGYQSAGINTLAQYLGEISEITVVAPSGNRSCASSALSVRQSIAVERTDSGIIVVDGTPGDCVHLAVNGMLDFEPDMVVSGINEGSNLGDDVIYSGTVAAAIEGRFLGLPAIAVSLVGENLQHYNAAAEVISRMIQQLEHSPLQRDTILNVNVPDCPYHALKGIEATRCGARHQSQPIIDLGQDGDTKQFQIGPAGQEADAGPGTDFYAIAQHKVSVTPLQIDMTRYSRMQVTAQWVSGLSLS